jgi:solute carrier family 25 folate transporter 32
VVSPRRTGPADGGNIPPGTILVCSSVSKMIASVTTYPHEVLRTRLQIQRTAARSPIVGEPLPPADHRTRGTYSGITTIAKTIMRDEGLRGFYRGLMVNLLRTVPSSAMTILTCVMRLLLPAATLTDA